MRPDKPSDPAPLRLELPGGAVSFTDEGAGPPVVCVHGLPGSARDFRWLAPALVEVGFRVVRVELPGFGGSEAKVPPDVDAWADWLGGVVLALRLDAPNLLGHSFGAVVAARHAVRAPSAVARLALVASPGLRRHRGLARASWGVELERWSRWPVLRAAIPALLARGLRAAGFRHDVDPRRAVLTMRAVGGWDFGRQADTLARLRTPTTVAWCADDPFIEDAIATELARRAPDGPRLRFLDGGHVPQKHHAVEIAQALAAWRVERVPRRDTGS